MMFDETAKGRSACIRVSSAIRCLNLATPRRVQWQASPGLGSDDLQSMQRQQLGWARAYARAYEKIRREGNRGQIQREGLDRYPSLECSSSVADQCVI